MAELDRTAEPGTTAEPGRRRSLRIPLAILAVGAIMAIGGFATTMSGMLGGLTSEAVETPGSTTRSFEAGEYVIYELATAASVDDGRRFVIETTDVNVVGSAPVQVRAMGSTQETITRFADVYLGVVRFDVVEPGEYRVDIASSRPGQVIVSRGLGSAFGDKSTPFVVGMIGAVIGAIGFMWAFVRLLRRPSGRAIEPPSQVSSMTMTPPGWYPDTERPGGLRWWDGRRWTDHRHTS